MEQANLAPCFKVTGLPPTTNQIPLDVMNSILSKLGLVLETTDVKQLNLIQYKNNEGSLLIATLWTEKRKNEIMAKFKAALKEEKPILVEHVFNSADMKSRGNQIRFRNLLTKHNSQLLAQAHAFRGKPFKHIWEANGKILARMNDGGKATVIKSVSQLVELSSMKG
jgi:hypothetical protein